MEGGIFIVVALVVVLAFVLFGALVGFSRFYRQVEQGRALIVNTMRREPFVTFTGAMVFPVVNRAEVMDMSVKTVEVDRRGKEGLICKDNIRADINVNFFVRVNKTEEDVLKVAQSVGCARASDPAALRELFTPKFSEALKTVGKHFNFEDLYRMREEFKDQIIKVIGKDLNGFILDDAAIDFLEQTPLQHLDRDNIMDAEGIRKITDLTVVQNLQTNELRQKERMETGSQNLSADEAVFRFEQRRAEAEAKKDREVAVARAREQNEAERVANEERKRTLLLAHKNEEEELVAAEAKARGVAIAQKGREREIAIEAERVERARQLEAIGREREVALVAIARDKDVEVQRKEIADVVRARVAVDKTVAAEEEYIKDLRATAQASREKEVVRITAEAEAQGALVKQVKAAEASEEVAKHKARERAVAAEAELEASDKLARAKARVAEGTMAEAAAAGLAQARVKEADAEALEKLGRAEAAVTRERLSAEAAGEELKGVAIARAREAEAAAIEKRGLAEAAAVRERLLAEAAGLGEKANAMKALDAQSREHEEFRLRLEKDKAVQIEAIHARRDVAAAQAQVLAGAFSKANINIVGGDGQFFDRFIKAVSIGQTVEAALDHSGTLRGLVHEAAHGGGGGEGKNGSDGWRSALERILPTLDDATRAKLVALAAPAAPSAPASSRPPIVAAEARGAREH
ncbi:MAG TPA: SPFH domain-containing protein [Polyangiaceae bacterium]|nr:SPFH domain-containing protein [Polyangiaceae bacterium]